MFTTPNLTRFAGAVAMSIGTLTVPLIARAQDVPSYAQPAYAVGTDETLRGRIRSVDGAFTISVDDDRGFVDQVRLHGGTIINPTGLTLSDGMAVTILGVNAGSTFDANEIDTPYSYDGPIPTPVYLGPGYWCPGYGYGYGPAFSLGIVFGGGRGWSYEHRPFYGRPWNGSGYFGAYVGQGAVNRGHVAEAHPATAGERFPTSAGMHPPSAFAGRAFAGESRTYADRRSAPTTFYHAESEARSATPSRSTYSQSAPAYGGSNRSASPRSFGGSPRASAPASHGGGGRPH